MDSFAGWSASKRPSAAAEPSSTEDEGGEAFGGSPGAAGSADDGWENEPDNSDQPASPPLSPTLSPRMSTLPE